MAASGLSVDPELAAFLIEDGEEVTPILPPSWGDGDDDGTTAMRIRRSA